MIYVFLADGFEETEAIAPIDMLRRAKLDVRTVGIGTASPTSSHGVKVAADITEQDIRLDSELQLIVLPGGMPGNMNFRISFSLLCSPAECPEHSIWRLPVQFRKQ